MWKAMQLMGVVIGVMLITAAPALAQESPSTPVFSGAAIGAGFGVALAIIGAGYGFGRIGSAALESMARQPEIAGRIQTGMLIIAALLEGATFFGLFVCYSLLDKVKF
jgi:F-type H+-transporting ATPase subunit c